jgi:hypothetical protein
VDNFQDQKDNLRGEDASNKKVEGVQGLRIPKNLQKALTNLNFQHPNYTQQLAHSAQELVKQRSKVIASHTRLGIHSWMHLVRGEALISELANRQLVELK